MGLGLSTENHTSQQREKLSDALRVACQDSEMCGSVLESFIPFPRRNNFDVLLYRYEWAMPKPVPSYAPVDTVQLKKLHSFYQDHALFL